MHYITKKAHPVQLCPAQLSAAAQRSAAQRRVRALPCGAVPQQSSALSLAQLSTAQRHSAAPCGAVQCGEVRCRAVLCSALSYVPGINPVYYLKKNDSCEIEYFIATNLCQLREILRSRVRRILCDLLKNVSPYCRGQDLTAVGLSECIKMWLWICMRHYLFPGESGKLLLVLVIGHKI